MKEKSLVFKYTLGLFFTFVLIIIDQITKYLTVMYLKDGTIINIIPNVFCLKYLENRGAAFGMLQGQQTFFLVMTFIVIIILPYIYTRIPVSTHFTPLRLCIIFLASGAIGNMIDRIRLGYVIDFLYFELIDFPIFNVADIYVTVTTAAFLILLMFYYKESDLEQIHILKKKEK